MTHPSTERRRRKKAGEERLRPGSQGAPGGPREGAGREHELAGRGVGDGPVLDKLVGVRQGGVYRARWRRGLVHVSQWTFSLHHARWEEAVRPVVIYRPDGVPDGLGLRKPRVTPELLAQITGVQP